MTKQKTIAAMTALTMAAVVVAPAADAASLRDISSSPFSYEITKLVDRGILSGYGDQTFKPNKVLTRSDVVKILGKYLVSLGYDIPHDYKSNIRFNDLSVRTDEELLKYAALVKDVGVFNGDRGRLLAKNNITNEQAANVLVRAFTKIDAFDYITFVEQQTFFKEFVDTNNMKGESKQSIDVIDYYNIVERDNYYPKQTITRGSFASMLYRMIEVPKSVPTTDLFVRNIIAVTPTRLTVQLSDMTTHNVFLDEPLKENVSTLVSFLVNGEEYEGRVTYHTQQLEITDIESLNSGQFIVYFNQEVDLPTTYAPNDLAKIFSLTKTGDYSSYHQFLKGELSADKKSFIVTLSSKTPLSGTYRLNIEGVRALNGKSLADFDESVYFVNDTTKPTVKSIENVTKNLVKVTFSEPVYTNNYGITYTLPNGKITSAVIARSNERTYYTSDVITDIYFDLTSAGIRDYQTITAKITGLRDLAGNMLSTEQSTFNLMKTGQDFIAPKLLAVEQIGAKQFKLIFNEAMEAIYPYQLRVVGDNDDYNVTTVERITDSWTSFIVTVDNYLDGKMTISTNSNYPVKDATGTEGNFSKSHIFDYNTTTAIVENTETIREDNMLNLYVYFDRNVVVDEGAKVTLNGTYSYKGSNVPMRNAQPAIVYATGDPRVVKIPIKELVKNYDRLGSVVAGELNFTNVYNEYAQAVAPGFTKFERQSDMAFNTETLQLLSVETSRTSKNITDSRKLYLNFNLPLDDEGVTDLFNYELMGYRLKSAELNQANTRQVILTIDSTISAPVEPYLYVYNLKASSSMVSMDTYYERVFLNENSLPYYVSHTVTGQKEIKLTFSEALNPVDARTFYVENSAGVGTVATSRIDPTDSRRIILTFETALVPYSTMKIRLMPGRTISDLYYNEASFPERSLYIGSIR